MSDNATNMYDIDPHVAEVYDQVDTDTDDVEFLRSLVAPSGPLRILEPFCGTGRILIPLARDGHTIVGVDQARSMLNRAQAKITQLPEEARARVSLIHADATTSRWPAGFDLVVLAGNCFYELASPVEQEACIRSAASALGRAGHLFVDNDHMEGELDSAWQQRGESAGFPTGQCADGVRLEGTGEAVWWDAPHRLIRFRRRTRVILPDGTIEEHEFMQQKHPVSAGEVQSWLEAEGFAILAIYGDHSGSPYRSTSERAIFWASKGAA